jgi:hypothetical protein
VRPHSANATDLHPRCRPNLLLFHVLRLHHASCVTARLKLRHGLSWISFETAVQSLKRLSDWPREVRLQIGNGHRQQLRDSLLQQLKGSGPLKAFARCLAIGATPIPPPPPSNTCEASMYKFSRVYYFLFSVVNCISCLPQLPPFSSAPAAFLQT